MAKSCFVVSEESMTQTCGTETRLTSMPKQNTHIYIYTVYIDTERTAVVKDGD